MADERLANMEGHLQNLEATMAAVQETLARLQAGRGRDERREDSPEDLNRRARRLAQEIDDDLSNLKLTVPKFAGKYNADEYLDWERSMEDFLECHHYSERKKVILATLEFTDYAALWWSQFKGRVQRDEEDPIESWRDLKRIMRKKFVPGTYTRDLHTSLRNLKQGTMSVEQ